MPLLSFNTETLTMHKPDCEFVTRDPSRFLPVPYGVAYVTKRDAMCRCLRPEMENVRVVEGRVIT